ncbi:MAG: threonine-phosphate decarboxylase CobD [Candidatus Bathyarchaeota archaeon]|nr:threonine-phosphate decarboxylase CobD [Candidatus Bathyarchaeota archaeon]
MVDISELIKAPIRELSPCVHGGNVWKISEKFKIPLDQVIDFSVPINPLGIPEKVLQSIRQRLSLIKNYPDPDHEWLIETLSNYVGVKPNNIIVGNGSTELIYLFTEVFLESGYDAVIPIPTFGEYKTATMRVGGRPLLLRCDPAKNFRLKFQKLEKAISKKTRIIFFCNPNSPTGILYEKDEVLRIVRLAAEKNVLVFLDEDYVDFVDDDKRYSMAEYVTRYNNLFVLRSLTKFFALAGLRIGFGIASPDVVMTLKKAKMPWSVNSLAMFAATEAVKDGDFIKKSRLLISRSKRHMQKMLQEIPWLKVYPSETNFFLIEIAKVDLTSTQLKEGLARKGLLIRDCSDFDGLNNRFFRVSVNKTEENKKLIGHLKTFADSE